MKKVVIYSLLTLGVFTTNEITAQDSKSTPIISQVSQNISKSSGIQTDFVMTYYDNKNTKKQSMSGKLKMKGDSYVVNMNNHKIYCDGQTVINYLVNNKEVQLSKFNRNDLLSPSQLFSANFGTNFSYKYFSSTTLNGKNVSVIEFVPKRSNKSVKKMHLFIDQTNKVIGGKLFDSAGGYYYYTLSNTNMNAKTSANEFTLNYKALAGVEVIDLR